MPPCDDVSEASNKSFELETIYKRFSRKPRTTFQLRSSRELIGVQSNASRNSLVQKDFAEPVGHEKVLCKCLMVQLVARVRLLEKKRKQKKKTQTRLFYRCTHPSISRFRSNDPQGAATGPTRTHPRK